MRRLTASAFLGVLTLTTATTTGVVACGNGSGSPHGAAAFPGDAGGSGQSGGGGGSGGASSGSGGTSGSGGNNGSGGTTAATVTVTIEPRTTSVETGKTKTFRAVVTGSNPAVDWSVTEGAAGGAITAAGLYTAPGKAGTYHVKATSKADPSRSDTATVNVTQGPPPALIIEPKRAMVLVNKTAQFSASVTGLSSQAVTWKVEEASGGTVSATGLYTAPGTPGTFHVVATSTADSTLQDRATATVSSPATGTPGVWENVTPPELSMDPDAFGGNFGMMDVLADPARPSDFYAFHTQGVWKSVDFGMTWAKVSATGSPIDQGRPWGEAIDPNPNRDPNVPPVMFGCQGYGSDQGIFKSTDGAVTWTQTYTNPEDLGVDIYSIDIDPNDSQHVLASFHGPVGNNRLVESKDGGATWRALGPAGGASHSAYIFFVTSTTWLMVSQWDEGGTWRTTDSGDTWNMVSTNDHYHGCNQIYVGGGGLVYLPGAEGIERSTDYGATFTNVYGETENSIVATASYLYASSGWATGGVWDAVNLARSPLSDGKNWSSYATKPDAMTNGAKRTAVSFDGTHYVIISSNWLAGIWRYVEQ